jgi:hypothetical protein
MTGSFRMVKRLTRSVLGLAGVGIVSGGLVASLEWDRPRQPAMAGPQTLDGSGQVVSSQQPVDLARLCDLARERFAALHERELRLHHTRKSLVTEYDRRGERIRVTEVIERVWFEGGREKTELLGQRSLLGRAAPSGPAGSKLGEQDALLPFANDAGHDVYAYRFDGVEDIEGRRAVRVRFDPKRPADGTCRGWAWLEPATGEPVRAQLSPVKLPLFVDRVEMLLDFGRAENGHNQLRRAVIDGSGGFALVSRRLHVEAELTDYREVNK